MLDWLYKVFFAEDVGMAIAFATALFLLGGAMLAGYSMRNAGVYAGAGATVVGGMALFVLLGGRDWKQARTAFATLAILGGISYIGLICTLELRKRLQKRRELRELSVKKTEYALPDKENTLVRERLNTVLKTVTEEESAETYFRFVHAQKLLAKVREKPLTNAERLETEEMDALFHAFSKKEKWNFEDIRIVNEAFARVLKLSAKYAV